MTEASDEMAAAIAAVMAYLESEQTETEDQQPANPWGRAGRLEAQGIPLTPEHLVRNWGA